MPEEIFENFEFSYWGCTDFLRQIDWNENVTDDEWRVKLTRATNCMRHREQLSRDAGASRPAAFGGVHVPTVIVPTTAEDLPHLPPFYFVLPMWDMVVSNRVRLSGLYDPQELDVLLRLARPGSAFVDIGANVGSVTVPLAAHVGREGVVYSFEPFRQVFQFLNANVATNGLENVHTFHTALSEEGVAPTVRVPVPSLVHGQNAGMYGVFKQDSTEPNDPTPLTRDRLEDITVRTLDSFDLPRADVIKIDVEGHAPNVLAGGLRTLQRHRPILWFEGDTVPEVLLRPDLRYQCTKIDQATEDTHLCAPLENMREVLRTMSEWAEWDTR